MKISRERTILMAVLGVGLGGLIVDRVILGYDATAPASAQATVVSEAALPAGAVALPASAATPRQTGSEAKGSSGEVSDRWHQRMAGLADLLDQATPVTARLAPPTESHDLFGGNADWLRPEPVAPAAPKPRQPKQPFDQRYQLEAVLGSPSGAIAIINGRNYQLGSTIDGYTLASIDQRGRTVAFVQGEQRVTLKLDQ